MFSRRTTEFRLLTAAVLVAALMPRLAHRGMFLDGLTYASIARNLAEGRGRFWEPFYTATIYPGFHEHPPLAFWLESLYFRALGDHWWVERLYCSTAAALTALLIGWTWRASYDDRQSAAPRSNADAIETTATTERKDARDLDWLPALLWIFVPAVSWTIAGNLLETTVSVFVTAAVASLVAPKPISPVRSSIVAGAASGLCVVAAALSKGPVGLFPLAGPLALGILPERRRSLPWLIVGQWAAIGACALFLFAGSASRQSLNRYVSQQVLATLLGDRGTSGSSMTTAVTLLEGVCLPMLLAVGMMRLAAGSWIAPQTRDGRIGAVFILIGLAGTLPIMVSPRQSGHYVVPAIPFYAIGVAALGREMAHAFRRRLESGGAGIAIRIAAVALVTLAIAAARMPALERDAAWLTDLDRIAAVAPRGATVGICGNVNGNWLLHAWMQRRFQISLDATGAGRDWFLKTDDADPQCAVPACLPVSSGGRLVLLRCR